MAKLRKFIKKAVYETLLEEPIIWFYARDLEEKISNKIERNISAYSIAHYLKFFSTNEIVIRVKERSGYKYKLKRRLKPEEVYF